ncbi:MAG: CBS domain-containing protein [Acidimicrobiia bacterium]|nr:CBS domain-containing protein [Acidimicrobiia bacterium]
MSARAAWRLEQLGFAHALDYHHGRKDWESAGLPMEGTDVAGPTIADALSHDPPTIDLGSTVGDARALLGEGATQVIVVNDVGIVMGVMRKESWERPDGDLVEDAMRLGPSTVRPGSQLAPLVERMKKKDVESVIVSDPEGHLIGVLVRETGSAVVAGEIEETFETCESCPGWWRHRVKDRRESV